jgi:hypothetical protein
MTNVKLVVMITYLSAIDSSIVNTRPKAIAPLIIPENPMKRISFHVTYFLCLQSTNKPINPIVPVSLPTTMITISANINCHDQG